MNSTRLLRFLGRNALVGLALVATLVVSALATMRVVLTSRDVAVPSLVGRLVPEAGREASLRGLLVRIEGRRHDPAVPAERVVAQEPPPGARPTSPPVAPRCWSARGRAGPAS